MITRVRVASPLMFENRMPRYEILSEDAMAVFEGGWRRLIAEMARNVIEADWLRRVVVTTGLAQILTMLLFFYTRMPTARSGGATMPNAEAKERGHGTVNVPTADQWVSAGVVGEALPCIDRTRQ